MAVSYTTFSGLRTEMGILETKQYLHSQLEKSKQDFRDLTEKLLTSQATVYSLANQLQKYKCEECKDLIESVLEEEMPFEEGNLAEKRRLATRLGRYDPLIEAQARELTCLRQKIHEGKGVCHLFTQHAKNTIKTSESFFKSTGMTYYQRQRYCELLAQGSQLAERLAGKLSTENHHDRKDEEGQESRAARLIMGLQEEEVKEVPEASLDEKYLMHSSRHDCHQPPSSIASVYDEQDQL